jgi:DNA-binding HxlR family transcriptional regulator
MKKADGTPCTSPCPIQEVTKFLAGAWTPEIFWNLRFGELQRAIGGVSAKVLTQRLRDLEDLDVVAREVKDTYPPQVEYSLTPLGRSFGPILESIAEVGQKLIRKSKRHLL